MVFSGATDDSDNHQHPEREPSDLKPSMGSPKRRNRMPYISLKIDDCRPGLTIVVTLEFNRVRDVTAVKVVLRNFVIKMNV